MYLTKSILEGLHILGFDKEIIKKVSRERSLEEIFLSTLFLNYFIVLTVYLMVLILGGISIAGREVKTTILFGLLMIYPFIFNLGVYVVYGLFGLMSEMINSKSKVKPLLSVGFHTAIVYTLIFYVIGLSATFNLKFAGFLMGLFLLYFIYTMFVSISAVYQYSFGQTLIVLFIPFLLISLGLLLIQLVYPSALYSLLRIFFN